MRYVMGHLREQAVFALHVFFALLSLSLLALDMVEIEVALTRPAHTAIASP